MYTNGGTVVVGRTNVLRNRTAITTRNAFKSNVSTATVRYVINVNQCGVNVR